MSIIFKHDDVGVINKGINQYVEQYNTQLALIL